MATTKDEGDHKVVAKRFTEKTRVVDRINAEAPANTRFVRLDTESAARLANEIGANGVHNALVSFDFGTANVFVDNFYAAGTIDYTAAKEDDVITPDEQHAVDHADLVKSEEVREKREDALGKDDHDVPEVLDPPKSKKDPSQVKNSTAVTKKGTASAEDAK